MLINQKVKVRWSGNNKKWYEEKGYLYTKIGDTFECNANDLSPSSDYYVWLRCDYCGNKYQAMYKKHLLHTKIVNKDACEHCKGNKNVEVKLAKYNTASPTIFDNWQESQAIKVEKVHNKLWENVKQICEEKDYELLNNKFDIDIQYICNKHREFGIQTISWNHLNNGEGCKICGYEHRADKQRFTYEYVKNIIENDFKEDNCKLLSGYTNYNDYSLKIKCNCGDTFVTSLYCFIHGKRKCNKCSIKLVSGENHWNWKGGLSNETQLLRFTPEYKDWRKQVFKRDNYTCQCCGDNSGGNLEAHHIENFSSHPELRFDTNNGITLCTNCHSFYVKGGFHNIYGTINNTKEQLIEYLSLHKSTSILL